MLGLIAVLLVIWLVIGAVVKGLSWLLIIGAVLFLATAAFGWVRRHSRARRARTS